MNVWTSISGMIEAELLCADIPEALKELMTNRIPLHHAVQKDALSLIFYIGREDYHKLEILCRRKGYLLKIHRKMGVFWFFQALIRRPILVLGGFLILLAVGLLPTKVLFIQVSGNQQIPSAQILSAAETIGVRFGVSRKAIRSELIKNKLLQKLPELQWVGVNTSGCTATISVREKAGNVKLAPNIGNVGNIVASRDGIVVSIVATKGNVMCRVGQAVQKGDTLISGYFDCGAHLLAAHAEGEVFAVTSRNLTAYIPSEYLLKTGSHKKFRRRSLIIGKKRINFWLSSGIQGTECGRMYRERVLTLPGGFTLPIKWATEELSTYSTQSVIIPEESLLPCLSATSEQYTLSATVAGIISTKEEKTAAETNRIRLTAVYYCQEMIGRYQQEPLGETNGETS